MSKDFFKDLLGNKNKHQRNTYNEKLLTKLYKVPKKDKGDSQATFHDFKPFYTEQADLLFLPMDNGYKYALVCVDCATKLCDAEPIKNKSSVTILKAIKKIWNRKIITPPKNLEVDPGGEFKGDVKNYCNDNDIHIRISKVGRHRQQALVERKNQVIGTALTKAMVAEELSNGNKINKKWVKNLPILISVINERVKEQNIKDSKKLEDIDVHTKQSLLNEGDKVRCILEEPRNVSTDNSKLHGKFRSGDIRWDPTIRIIDHVLLKPGYPPLYLLQDIKQVDKFENVAYTKNQLQLI